METPLLADLIRRVDRLTQLDLPNKARISAEAPLIPYWYVERGSSLGALSGDWDDQFDAEGVTLYPSRVYSGGKIDLTSLSTTYPVRARMKVIAPYDCEVSGIILTGTNAQLKVNGEITDTASTASVTIRLLQGENIIRFAQDGTSGTACLECDLFAVPGTQFSPVV